MIKYSKSKALTDNPLSYCPGCTHGIIHKLVAESLTELDVLDKTIGVSSVGCSVMTYKFFNCDMQQAAHGRSCAVATGIKRCNKNAIVFTYQGDGDLALIGIAETIHAANRGENITVIFVNNCIYGMTGGQMSPTTLINQKTSTSQDGRNASDHGYPIKMCEIISQLVAPVLVERVAVNNPANVIKAKKVIKKAFENQKLNKGFSFVEILSSCPINWGKTSKDSLAFIEQEMMNYFPVKNFVDKGNN